MQFDWMVQGEKIRDQNNKTVTDYAALLDQEKERIEAEEAAEAARAAAAELAINSENDTNVTTNELSTGDDAVDGVGEALAAVENGEANNNEQGFQITDEDIDKLGELHGGNEGIDDLQNSLKTLLAEGKNIGDLPEEHQIQIKELLGLNKDKALGGKSLDNDQASLRNINDQINNGASASELFQQQLLEEAQDLYGEAELISEETADDGTITKKFKATDGTEFSLVEVNRDGAQTMNLNLDDGSLVSMNFNENLSGGVGIARYSAVDEESGGTDYTFVNLDVQQEGRSRTTTDENGQALTVNNYTQTNADGSINNDVTSQFFADGTNVTRWEDDEGIGNLVIGNKDFTASESYTSADNYQTATINQFNVNENGEGQWRNSIESPGMVGPSLNVLNETESARRNQNLELARSGGFEEAEITRVNEKITNLLGVTGDISEDQSQQIQQDAIAATSNLAEKAKNGELTMTLEEFIQGDSNNPVIMQQSAQYMAALEESLAADLTNQQNVFQEMDTDLGRASAADLETQIETANRLQNGYQTMDEGLNSVVEDMQIDFGGIDEANAQAMLQDQVALKQDLQAQLTVFQGMDTDLGRASAVDIEVQLAISDKIISELARQFP
ncbi:MAG: hypothetical protein MK033_10165 [Candidatus Caenarcaniphilales bacterium]|nr:hypothetical protein [Candidatus Caenarcaniphilales bacterium]